MNRTILDKGPHERGTEIQRFLRCVRDMRVLHVLSHIDALTDSNPKDYWKQSITFRSGSGSGERGSGLAFHDNAMCWKCGFVMRARNESVEDVTQYYSSQNETGLQRYKV